MGGGAGGGMGSIFNVGARFENFKDIFKINTIMNKNLEFHNPHQLFELSLKDLSAAQHKLEICHKYEQLLTHSFVWDTLRFASNQGLL